MKIKLYTNNGVRTVGNLTELQNHLNDSVEKIVIITKTSVISIDREKAECKNILVIDEDEIIRTPTELGGGWI